jgi:hypothetical protein
MLTNPSVPIQIRLIEAGRTLHQAASDRSLWPADFLERADHILERLLADGTVAASVAHADRQTVRRLVKDICDLVADIDMVRSAS